MCGILGVLNGETSWKESEGLRSYMGQGCITGIFRGMDSTGMFQTGKDGNTSIHKATVNGYYFSQLTETKKLIGYVDSSYTTFIHHRASTRGSSTYDNAHPFSHTVGERNVVGVHNGTLDSFYRRDDGIDFDVDSDWLYYRIAKDGHEKALSEIEGSYALAWVDESKRLFLAANDNRPLHWAAVKGKNQLLIASEPGMLHWLATRCGMETEQIFYPATGKVFQWKLGEDVRTYTTVDIPKPKKKAGVTSTYPLYQATTTGTTSGLVTTDSYGDKAIDNVDYTRKERVEFVYKHTRELRHGVREVWGEVISKNAEVNDAVFTHASEATANNMKTAETIIVEVLGTRTSSGSGDGEIVIIVSDPVQIVQGGVGDLASMEEPPFVDVLYDGPGRRKLTFQEFTDLTKHGCACCSKDLFPADQDFIVWMGSNPVCTDCAADAAGITGVR